MQQKTRVLVTGANGFVGSHVLEALSKDPNIEAIGACRNRFKIPFHFEGEVREGDLTDPHYLQTMVKNIDVICHAAAWTALWNHAQTSEKLFLNPSLALIDAAKSAGVQKFIFTSSTSVSSSQDSENALIPGTPRRFWPHLRRHLTTD